MYSKNNSVAEEVRFTEEDQQNKASKPHRISEIKALGTENRKVYRMSDGSEQAVFCPGLDLVFNPKTAAFEKADNTLIETKDHRYFKNKNGKFLARFSNERENNELFFIEKDGHSIGVSVRKTRTQEKGGFLPHLKMRYTNAQHEQSNQMLAFDDVLPDTDMEYTVSNDGIKENIIIRKKRPNYRYRFWLDCANLSVSFDTKTKAVHFLDPQTEERIFEIPAPFMVDALGARSEDVFYDLKRVSGKRIAFTVQADSNWINAPERVLPITIDPQINLSSSNFLKTITKQNDTLHTGTAEEHTVGKSVNTYGNISTYSLKIQMPTWDELSLPPHAHIESAALTFTQKQAALDTTRDLPVLQLYAVADVPSSGSSSGSDDDDDDLISPCHRSASGYALTQETDSNTDLFDAATSELAESLIDYATACVQPTDSLATYTFDITRFMDRTVGNSYDYGQLMLKLDIDDDLLNWVTLYGTGKTPNTATDGTDYRPKLTITYTCDFDTSAQQRSHTQDLGRFGQSHVDLLHGTLTLSAPDFKWSGNRMPVSIAHLYHSGLCGYRYSKKASIKLEIPENDMYLGNGWRLNVMESMSLATPPATNGVSGTAYLYTDASGKQTYFIDNGNGEFKDAEENGMTYNANTKTMTHEDNTYQFDANGFLISVMDKNGNEATITYQNKRITAITDGAGREFEFSYDPNGALVSITAPDGSIISYTYQGNYLSSITYPDGNKAEISYQNNLPSCIYLKNEENITVHQATYTYDEKKRVSKVVEHSRGTADSMGSVTYQYQYSPADRRTVVSLIKNDQVLNKIVYDFYESGAIKNVYHHNSSPTHAEQYRATNLLKDHDFASMGAWLAESGNAIGGTAVSIVAPTDSVYGSKCLQISNACGDAYGCGVKQESVWLQPGEYTFSAYVKCISGTATARICVEASGGTRESESISASGEYTRLTVPFKLSYAQRVKCRILTDGHGSVWVHAPQLENNACANPYNMIVNGNFNNAASNWQLSPNATRVQIKEDEADYSLLLMASKDSQHITTQTVAVKTPASTRETFTLSGWAKRYEAGSQKTNTKVNFGLGVKFFYGNEVYVPPVAYKAFSPYTNDWQFTSITFAKPNFTPVDYIEICCVCQGLEGGAYFDDIALVRESLETDLTVDDFMTENEEETEATEGFEEVEDAYGNPVTLTAFDEEHTADGAMYRSFGYSTDGNDLVRFTDTRGKNTVFAVEPSSSRVSSITDRCGSAISYDYNDAGATESMSLQIPEQQTPEQQDTAPHLSYTYDDCGNLLSVARGDGLVYNFAYAPFHRLQEVKLTGKNELLYKHACTQDHKLQEIFFANGYEKRLICNSLGQVVTEAWYDTDNTVIAEYHYTYDRSGNVARVLDNLNNKEYNYIYQDGSLVRFTERDTTTGMIVAEHRYRSGKDTLEKELCFANGTQVSCKYTDTEKQQTAALSFDDSTTLNIVATLDSHGRKTAETVKLGGNQILHRDFTYHVGTATPEHVANEKCPCAPTTPLVSSICSTDGRTLSYTYDNERRITEVDDNFNGVTTYTYDAQGQLLKEEKDGVTLNDIKYDGYGNILSKNGTVYTYDTVWKDQLTAFGNESIDYDAQGNPTSYLGHTLTWTQGNRLNTFDNTSYAYNHQGLRTQKTVNGVAHTYLWEGTRLISEACNGNTMITFYGSDGSVCGILYNDIRYYFNKNLQGDVISILNMAGNTVAKYTYDAWGKLLSVTDAQGNSITDSSHIALINPYRYRGYYFDSESNFYYLQTRYYDPETGRFISPDNISYLDPESFTGLNLYVFANNNSIANTKLISRRHMVMTNGAKMINLTPSFNITIHSISSDSSNYWNTHWENKWFDTDWPSFLVLSKDGFKVVSWSLSVYKGSLYFDNNENYSLCVSAGNMGIYAGINYKKGIGLDASANVAEIGYDGRIFDATVEGLSIGFTYMYKDGKIELKHGYGLWGWSVSIDCVELFKWLFGGE